MDTRKHLVTIIQQMQNQITVLNDQMTELVLATESSSVLIRLAPLKRKGVEFENKSRQLLMMLEEDIMRGSDTQPIPISPVPIPIKYVNESIRPAIRTSIRVVKENRLKFILGILATVIIIIGREVPGWIQEMMKVQ